MNTSAISHRVADFLKQHPPFNAVDDVDLLELASRGRVRFHEPHEYILWQGEPHRMEVFVIQQGSVSLWDEAGEHPELRDVRGAGDMLGVEQFHDAGVSLYSARSSGDVVLYGFPAIDFEALILKYPYARDYVAAYSGLVDYQSSSERDAPHTTYLHDLVRHAKVQTCRADEAIRDVARRLWVSGADAMAVVDASQRTRGVLTRDMVLAWVAEGAGSADVPIKELLHSAPPMVAPGASVADGVLAMASSDVGTVAVTEDGTPEGRFQTLVTAHDLTSVFGEQPVQLIQEIRRATTTRQLAELNRRARALILQYLTSASAVEWLSQFAHDVDAGILKRVLAMTEPRPGGCWCFCGSAGRGELLTLRAPHVAVILDDEREHDGAAADYDHVLESLTACGYLPRLDLAFDQSFYIADASEWRTRFANWMRDPVLQGLYRARSLFDLSPVTGPVSLWRNLSANVSATVGRDFLYILANDCLTSLPPLTFFQDAVVDKAGEQTDVFRLEETALRPLVDVGRVFGMAARGGLGVSTRERLLMARTLLPSHEAIFREASETLNVVLWQQGRVGISQGTSGAELPPSLLSRSDRNVLKNGFRSILRLIELTADPAWLDSL